MSEVLRQDLFRIPTQALDRGFVVLNKTPPVKANPYLGHFLVMEDHHRREHKLPDNVVELVYDSALYRSIDDGDIGFVNAKGNIRVILSRRANYNTLLVTERCDNLCVFCSQPPKVVDDDWLLAQSAMAIAAFNTQETIGITGGEPLLYQESFLRFFDFIVANSPQTPLHILSNGRAFKKTNYTKAIAERCRKHDIAFGIPLYSASSEIHDQLVGTEGAYNETLLGLINAGNSGIPIELRFIPTQLNSGHIAETIELVARCISNVMQISIMNLEPKGWAKRNWDTLYQDPWEYRKALEQGIEMAERANIPVSLFNYPRCHIPETLRSYAVKSISDWKNYYPDECDGCIEKNQCSGYFSSSTGRLHQPPRNIQ